jgi:hypothetical protein
VSNGDAASGEFTVHELVIRVKRSGGSPPGPSGNRRTTTYTHYDNDGNRPGEYLKSPRADWSSLIEDRRARTPTYRVLPAAKK